MTPLMCMAVAIFFEARSEQLDGMIAIGEVIENRVQSSKFPDDVCSVVFQEKQFSFTHDRKSDNPIKYDEPKAWTRSLVAARKVRNNNHDLAVNATHYHADWVTPYWSDILNYEGKIGHHLFYIEE